jgi:hypothetical protein
VFVKHDLDSLSSCTTAALRYGYFKKFWLVDSNHHRFKIKSAKKLHGVGRFWGYDIFLNRKIRVELSFKDEQSVSLEEIKESIFKSFRTWHGWASADNFDELKSRVKAATSVREIINALEDRARSATASAS